MNSKIHKFFIVIVYSSKYHLNFNVTTTGRNLAEMCMHEYPKYVKYGLWLLIEVGVIAATIPGGIDFPFVHYFSLVWLL
jgi:natural resistance-associated macrophage protein